MLLGVIAVGSLLYLLVSSYLEEIGRYRWHTTLAASIADAGALSEFVHELQKERGLSSGFIAAPSADNAARVQAQRVKVDEMALTLGEPALARAAMADILAMRKRISDLTVDNAEAHDFFSEIAEDMLDQLSRLAHTSVSPKIKDDLAALTHLVFAKEYLGQIRAEVNRGLSHGEIDGGSSRMVARLDARFRDQVRHFRRDAPPAAVALLESAFRSDAAVRILAAIAQASDTGHARLKLDPARWFADVSETMDMMKQVEDSAMRLIEDRVAELTTQLRHDLLWHTLSTAGVALIILFLVMSTIRSMLRALDILLASIERIIKTKDFTTRITLNSHDEIGIISRGFNELLEIADRLLREKDYLAMTDSLTGIANRLHFTQILAKELTRRRRYPGPLSLIIFDIDHFKRINDTHGHHAGDEVLRTLAQSVAASLRETDLLARWGGEEFVVLAPETTAEAAAELAEKLRRLVESILLPGVGRITASFGVAGSGVGEAGESLCLRADRALYRAKDGGRNRVVVSEAAAAMAPDA